MAEQLKINYTSAYLKYQILKGAWFVHQQSVRSQFKLVHDFLNNNLVIDDNAEEPEMTRPYAIQLEDSTPYNPGRNISVIPIMGSLMKKDYCGAPGMQTIAARIRQAEESENINGILLHIDSPGGTVDGTQELGYVIKNCSKPIIAYADGLAASAGYWLASSANMVIAKDNTTEVGSIGVVLSFVDTQKAMEKEGYEFHDIFADQSSEKWKEMIDATNGDYSTIKEWTLNPLAEEFQETVRANRDKVSEKALKGRVYLAKQAKKYGLIDKIGNFDFAIKELDKLINNKHMSQQGTKVANNIPEDEKGFFEKLVSYVKPEVKDISENTKAEFEARLSEKSKEVEDLNAIVSELKGKIEVYEAQEKETKEALTTVQDENETFKTENEDLKAKVEELNTKLTKKVAVSDQMKVDDDKLDIGKLSEEEAAWAKEVKQMEKQF